ncbi:hypothetical protein WJX72_006271 [[Myrmecia] bisecta]|uniref:Uncharacterized protein n=1 Tax=[Myrmecia] bisecta TaxID=41462 RepID=A0AAW1QR20_9CHLO
MDPEANKGPLADKRRQDVQLVKTMLEPVFEGKHVVDEVELFHQIMTGIYDVMDEHAVISPWGDFDTFEKVESVLTDAILKNPDVILLCFEYYKRHNGNKYRT